MVATSARAPVEANALPYDLVNGPRGQSFQQCHSFPQGRLELDLAAHRPLSDGRNVPFHADVVGELVEALLADHRGIHVGEQELLAPALG